MVNPAPATTLELRQQVHWRFNPLLQEWILVSPHRTQRPWQGQTEKVEEEHVPEYDPQCYMCPGNPRARGDSNPRYRGTFVFDNDFPALTPATALLDRNLEDLMVARTESGICRVVCFSPRHDLTLATMSIDAVRNVVDEWVDQCHELGESAPIGYVQVFENRGAMMGASNPHPHCQIWASASLPEIPAREQKAQREHWDRLHSCLLCSYLLLEQKQGERLVMSNSHFVALVPFWAVWPFETLVLPVRHGAALEMLREEERDGLAEILQRLVKCYDRLFGVRFPYSMGFHQKPADDQEHAEWHLHAHFFPPLLRSATVRKFMVGYEMLCMPQRDIPPEEAAERLRKAASS
jgi:UDPglucose--hexose-1-phosphate uridylyltransferase